MFLRSLSSHRGRESIMSTFLFWEKRFLSPNSLTWTPTDDAEDEEGLRLFHLPVQLSTAHVGPVLQRCRVALTGNVKPPEELIAVPLIQGDIDVGIGDHTGDGAFLAGLCHDAVGALYEPHVRVWGQKHHSLLIICQTAAVYSSIIHTNSSLWCPVYTWHQQTENDTRWAQLNCDFDRERKCLNRLLIVYKNVFIADFVPKTFQVLYISSCFSIHNVSDFSECTNFYTLHVNHVNATCATEKPS